VGTFVLALYRSPPLRDALACDVTGSPTRRRHPPPPSPLESLKRIWLVCVDRNGIRLMLPYMFYTGVSIVFYSGMFTRQMAPEMVGPAMCILGGGQVVGGLVIGGVIDRLGVRCGCVLIVAVVGSAMAVAHVANSTQDRTMFWIASGLLGLAENGVQTTAYAILTRRFQRERTSSEHKSDVCDAAQATGCLSDPVIDISVSNNSASVQKNSPNRKDVLDIDEATVPLLTSADVCSSDHQQQRGASARFGASTTRGKCGPEFDSSDGFSALFLVQGVTIGVLFFLLPLSAQKSGTRSSTQQFLCEQAVVFGLLLVGVACLFADRATV
jgi:hypothetical protein